MFLPENFQHRKQARNEARN